MPASVEEERLRLLDKHFVALAYAPASSKARMNFPRSVQHADLVPLSILNNRLSAAVAFRGMDKEERAAWIRENVDAVGCAIVPASEARELHGTRVDLVKVETGD